MNPREEEEYNIAKRFKWIDSSWICIINREGMEKVVDIQNGFEEIAYGQVPMIDIKDYQDKDKPLHFYF